MSAQSAVPEAPPLLLQVAQGYDLLGRGQMEAAMREARAALLRAPQMVDALFLRGACLKAMGRFEEATESFEAGLTIEPDRAAALVSLANARAELGDAVGAETALRRALVLSPRLKAAHSSLISVCAMRGRDDLTEAACREALAIHPTLVNAHQQLAELHMRAGRIEVARVHRDTAYRQQNIFIEPATRPAPTALVLLTTDDGNVPIKYLLSRDRYTVVKWLIDYATPAQMANPPRHNFVFNAIAEPEMPHATHLAAERYRQMATAPFLNHPDRITRTSRPALNHLLGDLSDIVVPPSQRWHAGDPPPALAWPVVIRPIGSDRGVGVRRVEDAVAFVEATRDMASCDVSVFYDFASADGMYRKYRMMLIDRRPLPYHLAIGTGWRVNYANTDMPYNVALQLEEERFLDAPQRAIGARAMAALAAIGDRMDLDYAGVDFTLLPDGRVLVFEANAAMVVHPETEGGVLDYKNRAVAAILAAFDAMAARLSSPVP